MFGLICQFIDCPNFCINYQYNLYLFYFIPNSVYFTLYFPHIVVNLFDISGFLHLDCLLYAHFH